MNSPHPLSASSWKHAGDPSAAQLLPRAHTRFYVKLSAPADVEAEKAVAFANEWFASNFSARYVPVVSLDPEHSHYVNGVFAHGLVSPETASYAKGVLVGMLAAAGKEVS